MNSIRRSLSIALLASSWAGPLAAQSLVEAAEKARKARETQTEPAKEYTNADLEAGRPEGQDSDAGSGGAASRPIPPRSTGSEDEWRSRAEAARQAIAANEQRVEAARQRVNELRQDRNPTQDTMSPNREQDRQAELQQAFDEMKQAEADVEESLSVLVDLQREARVAGVPPGWLR